MRLDWRSFWIHIFGRMAAQTDLGSGLQEDLNPWHTQGEAFTSALEAPSYLQTLILTSFLEHIRSLAL